MIICIAFRARPALVHHPDGSVRADNLAGCEREKGSNREHVTIVADGDVCAPAGNGVEDGETFADISALAVDSDDDFFTRWNLVECICELQSGYAIVRPKGTANRAMHKNFVRLFGGGFVENW